MSRFSQRIGLFATALFAIGSASEDCAGVGGCDSDELSLLSKTPRALLSSRSTKGKVQEIDPTGALSNIKSSALKVLTDLPGDGKETAFFSFAKFSKAVTKYELHVKDEAWKSFIGTKSGNDQEKTLLAFLANVKYETSFSACKEHPKNETGDCEMEWCSGGKVDDYTFAKQEVQWGSGASKCNDKTEATCTLEENNDGVKEELTDSENCWWGRGAIQTSWPANYNAIYADFKAITQKDVCSNPDHICLSGYHAYLAGILWWVNAAPHTQWKAGIEKDGVVVEGTQRDIATAICTMVKPADKSHNAHRHNIYNKMLKDMDNDEFSGLDDTSYTDDEFCSSTGDALGLDVVDGYYR